MNPKGCIFVLAIASAAACACGGGAPASFGPTKVAIPQGDGMARPAGSTTAKPRQAPPASGVAKESPFPAVSRSKLGNGMGLAVVTSRTLPIVQVRLRFAAGSGFGPAPGVAAITAQMLKDGGTRALTSAELLRRIETLGADLSIHTDFDATVLSMAVVKDQVNEAMSLLSQVVREPRFDGTELTKLKSRAKDEAEDAARSSGAWTGNWLVVREIFGDKSPYGTYGALPSQIARVDVSQVRDFHRRFLVPKAATLVLAGDIDDAGARALADRAFGSWSGAEPPKVDIPPPRPAGDRNTQVFIAHRPKSVQSDVFVAGLAPPRKTVEWAPIRVANQILGGGVASRLFADVREQRSLAYRTSAQIMELSHGPQPLVLYAGTQTEKTADAVRGLLDNLAGMTTSPATTTETETARRYLSDIFAIRMETIGSIADMIVAQDTLGLPDGYWDAYRRELRATRADDVAAVSKALYDPRSFFVVVSGDADAITPALARYGEVTVVDPEQEFKTIRTVKKTP